MTQKELHNQQLLKEAEYAMLHHYTRRHFLKESAMGFGAVALGSLLAGCGSNSLSASNNLFDPANPLAPRPPMFPGKAKSVIYLHMAGAPSQLELFNYKPELAKLDGQDCPPSLLEGKNLHSFVVYLKCLVHRLPLNNTVKAEYGYRITCPTFQQWLMI